MCDPLILGIASTAIGAAGSLANASGMQAAQRQQQENVRIWQQQQAKNRKDEQLRQEQMRQEGEAARLKGAEDISVAEQQKRQAAEQGRLTTELAGESPADAGATTDEGVPISVADSALLSGQQGGDAASVADAGKKIAEAASEAKKRIGAMATVSSYGGSAQGLGTVNPQIQAEAGSAIDVQNEFRRGSLGAFNLEQAVEPVQVTYQPSPLANIFSSALGLGAQALGGQTGGSLFSDGSLFGGKAAAASPIFPVAPKASTFVGPARPLPTKYAGIGGNPAGLF